MKNNLVYLKQVEVEAPALVQEALTEELFKKLKMDPIPLRMYDGKDEWAGHCPYERYTEKNEIVISSVYLQEVRTYSEGSRKKDILSIYLHEAAHRLDKNTGHTATFLAINILLRLRADEEYLLDWVHLYDFQDESYDPNAYGWAWTIAKELHLEDLSIAKCVEIIHSRQQQYLDELKEIQEKLAIAERTSVLSEQRVVELKRHITAINKTQREIFANGFIFGAIIWGGIQFYLF